MQYWTHQQRGIEFVRDKAGSLLWYGMGSGKTLTSIGIMRDQEAQLILISCPKPVVRTWISEFEKHTNNEFDIIAPLTGSVEKKTKEIEKQLKYFGKNKKPKVVIVNYESIWRPGMGPVYDKFKNLTSTGFIRGQDWDLVFVDECFVKDTLIDTPMGSVKIQDLKIGDFVYGYDHDSEKIVTTVIKDEMINDSHDLCVVGDLIGTPGHPFYTQDGYKQAGLLNDDDFLFERKNYGLARIKLSDLRKGTDKTPNSTTSLEKREENEHDSLLRKILFSKMEDATAGDQSEGLYKRNKKNAFGKNEGNLEKESGIKENGGNTGEFIRKPVCKKQNRKFKESSRINEAFRLQNSKRRERKRINKSTVDIVTCFKTTNPRLSMGIGNSGNESSSGIFEQPSLQRRYCESRNEDCDRNRWTISQCSNCSTPRQEKGFGAEVKTMGGHEIQERRNIIESAKSVAVYNIETGTNNYFANGILVHNCQKLKSAGSKVSLFFKALRPKTKKRIGLSGTPTPNSPLDIYGIYRFLDPDIFGTSYQRFQMKYALMGGFENYTVLKIINQQELNQKVYSIADRVETEDVIELPDCSDIYVDCELSPKARKAYDEFYKEAILEFSSGTELTAANVLVKQLRLAQITSGTVLDDDGHEHVIDTAKLDTLEELILSMDEPCVVFTRFRSEVKQIRAMIESFKQKGEKPRTVCQIASGIDERDLFASGKADICVVNIQSGGVGLNELVRARYAFYYSTGYSSGDFEQSKARIRRPGSDLTKKVLYYHIIAKNTMDEVIKKSIDKKLNIIQTVLQDFSKNLCKKAA